MGGIFLHGGTFFTLAQGNRCGFLYSGSFSLPSVFFAVIGRFGYSLSLQTGGVHLHGGVSTIAICFFHPFFYFFYFQYAGFLHKNSGLFLPAILSDMEFCVRCFSFLYLLYSICSNIRHIVLICICQQLI